MRRFFLSVLIFSAAIVVNAQSYNKPDIPLVRAYFHEKIDSTQKLIEKVDGVYDSVFKPSDNSDLKQPLKRCGYSTG